MFENRVLRIIFGRKRGKVTGEWRRLPNKEHYDLYSSSNIIQIKKRWAGHVAHMGRQEKCIQDLVGKPQGNNYLENLGVNGRVIDIYLIFIVPRIVIFYGITNRCDDVQ